MVGTETRKGSASERVFVTGATGLVGLNVVRHLLNTGYDVVAGVRPSSNTQGLSALTASGFTLNVVTSNLLDVDVLSAAMQGCTVVVHCAGAVDPHARKEDIVDTNVGGTRSALMSAIKCGAQQFIHISSLSVITGQEDQFDVDETAPLRYCGEAYADSKVDAEKVVSSESRGKINWTILRPGFIYGPGERAWMPRLINSLRTGKAMLIDGGGRQTNVIYVNNLARAVELSIGNTQAIGQVYNLTDGQTPTKKELFDTICDTLGLPRVKKNIPRPVAQTVCNVVSAVAPMLPADTRKGLSRFSRAAFRLAGVNQGFSIGKAERELGYVNRVPFAEGMKETLAHFGSNSTSNAGMAVGVH